MYHGIACESGVGRASARFVHLRPWSSALLCDMSSSRKRRAAALTPTTEPSAQPPPALRKIVIAGGTPMHPAQIDMWRQGQLCDATITAEGKHFEVQRMVVASGSAFFRSAFTSGLAESDSAHVTLTELTASAVEATLAFLYTGECEVYEAELPDLVRAGAFLQITTLTDTVSAAVKSRLGPATALDTWSLADAHSLDDLTRAAKESTLKEFEAVVAASEGAFAALSHARLLELLTDDRLTVEREESVHMAIFNWTRLQPSPVDDEALYALLKTVRYHLVSREFFDSTVLTEPRLQSGFGMRVLFADTATGLKAAVFGGTRVGRRAGFGPRLLKMEWSREHKGANIIVSQDAKVATMGPDGLQLCSVRSSTPLPASGCHLIEVALDVGNSAYSMIGLVASSKIDTDRSLGTGPGFWGAAREAATYAAFRGIRQGDGVRATAPAEALLQDGHLFNPSDRIGLQVDMDKHTMTLLRNGTPIPALVFDNLPAEVYVAVSLEHNDRNARFVDP